MCGFKTALAAIMIMLVFAMAGALMVGCAPESPCPPVEIEIEVPFDPPSPGAVDPGAGTMHGIRLYVFDTETGVLAAIVSVDESAVSRGRIDIHTLPDGTYTFVAWGGGEGSAGLVSGFSTDAVIGVTTIGDFMMTLDFTPLSDGGPGEVAPSNDDFDDLFFAIAEGVTVRSGSSTVVPLRFTRNSNVLRVTVDGIDLLPGASTRAKAPVDVFVVGRNGCYSYDNAIDAASPLVRYTPSDAAVSGNEVSVGIKTLRLDVDVHDQDPVLLYVRDATTKKDLIWPLDVLESVMSIPGEDGRPLYSSQGDIDREYEFDIRVMITLTSEGAITVTITIDGWEIVRIIPNLPGKQDRK